MKKIRFLLLLFVGCMVHTHAQIGINTQDVRGIFHIDAGADNSATITAGQEANDVVVDANGNMGIGTVSPTQKLDVRGNVAVRPDAVTGNTSAVKFYENRSNGTDNVTMRAPDNIASDWNFVLPTNQPVDGYTIVTDAGGNTSWQPLNPSLNTLATAVHTGTPISIPVSPNGNNIGIDTNQRFFQEFAAIEINTNNSFSLVPVTFITPDGLGGPVTYNTVTYKAYQSGNYLISTYIVPNGAPRGGIPGAFYPVNLEVRKNCVGNDPTTGTIIMDNAVIRWNTNGGALRYTIAVNGMVQLQKDDTLNLTVYLNGTNNNPVANPTSYCAYPADWTYAGIAKYKALFSVTAL